MTWIVIPTNLIDCCQVMQVIVQLLEYSTLNVAHVTATVGSSKGQVSSNPF